MAEFEPNETTHDPTSVWESGELPTEPRSDADHENYYQAHNAPEWLVRAPDASLGEDWAMMVPGAVQMRLQRFAGLRPLSECWFAGSRALEMVASDLLDPQIYGDVASSVAALAYLFAEGHLTSDEMRTAWIGLNFSAQDIYDCGDLYRVYTSSERPERVGPSRMPNDPLCLVGGRHA